MANTPFIVPKLRDNKAWVDYKSRYPGGAGWRYDRALSSVRYVVNHHSVTNPTFSAVQDCNIIWNIHKANGWGGIGYNFVITSQEVTGVDGLRYAVVAYVGDIGSVRAHTPNTKGILGLRRGFGNEDLIAACMIGMLHQKNPTEAQLRSAYWLYRELVSQEPSRLPNLRGTLDKKLYGHKDFDATACPGNWTWQKPRIVNYTDPPKIEKKEEVRVATIPFLLTTDEDANLPLGQTRVERGVDGEKRIVWTVTFTNGKETARTVKSETIVKAQSPQITFTGTYVEPQLPVEPTPPPVETATPSNPWEWLVYIIIKLYEAIKRK
jgi:hypothetical protein